MPGKDKANMVIVAAEAVVGMVVNASGVARVAVVATTLPLSVTKFDVTSVVITRGIGRNADVYSAMSPAINGPSVQQEDQGFLLASGPVPPGLAWVGRGMTPSFLSSNLGSNLKSTSGSVALGRLATGLDNTDHAVGGCLCWIVCRSAA